MIDLVENGVSELIILIRPTLIVCNFVNFRCCSTKDCFCACRYKCGTWETVEEKLNKNGYKDCIKLKYGTNDSKEHVIEKIKRKGHEKCKV